MKSECVHRDLSNIESIKIIVWKTANCVKIKRHRRGLAILHSCVRIYHNVSPHCLRNALHMQWKLAKYQRAHPEEIKRGHDFSGRNKK
jgi:hypothetical protein